MDSITFWKGAICLATLASFMQAALALATSSLPLWKASPFTFLFTSRAATMSWYFQPTSCPSLPREQNLLPFRPLFICHTTVLLRPFPCQFLYLLLPILFSAKCALVFLVCINLSWLSCS